MKHLKRLLALCLCMFLAFEVASPALPQLGEWFSLKADAVPSSWDLESSDVDVEAEFEKLKNRKLKLSSVYDSEDGSYDGWYHLYCTYSKHGSHYSHKDEETVNIDNWEYEDDPSLVEYFESTDPKYEKIVLETDIGTTNGTPSLGYLDYDGGKRWDRSCLIQSNKVIDLNGHKLMHRLERKDCEATMFHVIGRDTTLVIMDSSPEQTGLISFVGQFHDTNEHYKSHQTRNLFSVEGGATVYVLGGNFVAGDMKLENIETGWMKFKRIGGRILKTALTCASAAFSVYSAITTGGQLGDAGGALDKVAGLIGMDSNSTGLVQTDSGEQEAKPPVVQSPEGGKNKEPDNEDINGRNSKDKPDGDTDPKAGGAASVVSDISGVYICTNKEGSGIYQSDNLQNEWDHYDYGDEIQVIEPYKTNFYKVKIMADFFYVYKNDFESLIDLPPRTGEDAFPDEKERIHIAGGLQMDVEEKVEEVKKDPTVKEFIKKVGDAGTPEKMKAAVEAYAATYGELTADAGKFYQIHWGSVFTVVGGSKLVIFGGSFWGHGQDAENRDEVINTSAGQTYIYGGDFKGLGGANIFNEGVDAAHLTIRGGTFDCSSVNCIRGKYDEDAPGDDYQKTEQIAGVRGYVNAPLSCYGESKEELGSKLVSDGRIQLCETAGAGNLVIKSTDPKDSNRITYTIYGSEDSVEKISHLKVTPNESEYMENAFKLVGDAENDGRPNTVPDGLQNGNGYIDFAVGNEFAYVAPLINAQTPEQVTAKDDSSDLEAAIEESGGWYYKLPLNNYIKNLRGYSRAAIAQEYNNQGENAAAAYMSYNLISTLRTYTYDLYTIDPVTLEDISLCAHKVVPSTDVLTGMIRLIPTTKFTFPEEGYENTYYLMSADKWKPGTYYRVKLTVSEYVRVGDSGFDVLAPVWDKTLNEIGANFNAVNATTSLIIRCRESETAQFTPLRFSDENLMVGETAHVNFLNAQVGRVDMNGQKIFSVNYKWYIKGHEDVPLVTTTRPKQQGGEETYTIEGAVFDDYTVKYDQIENYNRGSYLEDVTRTKKTTDYLAKPVGNHYTSRFPYYSGGMDFYIPKNIKLKDGTLLDLAGQEIYCEVTYGLCYTRWSRAFKYLPICDYRPEMKNGQEVIATTEAEKGTVRETLEQKTFTSKAIKIKANPNPRAGEPAYWSGGETIRTSIDHRGELQPVLQAVGTTCTLTYGGLGLQYAQQHMPNRPGEVFYITEGDGQDLDALIQTAIDSYPTHINTCPTVVLRSIVWEYYDTASGEWKNIKDRADKDEFLIEGDTLSFVVKEEPILISPRATEKCWVIFDSASMIYYILESEAKDVVYSIESRTPVAAIDGRVIMKENPDENNGDLERDHWTYDVKNKKLILKDFNLIDAFKKIYPRATVDSTLTVTDLPQSDINGLGKTGSDALIRNSYQYSDTASAALWFADDVTIELQGLNTIVLNPMFLTRSTTDPSFEYMGFMPTHYLSDDSYESSIIQIATRTWSGLKAKNITFTGSGSLNLLVAPFTNGRKTVEEVVDCTETASLVEADAVNINLSGSGYVNFRAVDTLGVKKTDADLRNVILTHLPSKSGEESALIRANVFNLINGEARFASTFRAQQIKALKTGASVGVNYNTSTKTLNQIHTKYAAGPRVILEEHEYIAQNAEAVTQLKNLMLSKRNGLLIDPFTNKAAYYLYRFNYDIHKHVWTAQEPENTYATATEPGSIKRFCVCGETKTEELPVFTVRQIEGELSGTNTVYLEWKEHKQAEKYDVYRAETENGSYTKITTVTKAFYSDKDLTTGKTYYYKVKAVRTANSPLESPFSDVVAVAVPIDAHIITVTDGIASVTAAEKGANVTIIANSAPAGMAFDQWEVVKGGITLVSASSNITTFVMGEADVEVKATYRDLPSAQHIITVTDGTASVSAAAKGATVTITANAAPAGKVFDKWEVVKGGITLADVSAATTTFEMGDADVKVKATYKDLPAAQHSVTVVNGTASANAAAKGTTIIITASAAPEGKAFDKWEVVKGGITLVDAASNVTTFVMGEADVEVKATYKDLPASQHSITVTGGTASVSAAAKGATVTITANAAPEGKVFDKWEVVKGGITLASATAASTTFTMGDADVEVKATYKDVPAEAPLAPTAVTAKPTDQEVILTWTSAENADRYDVYRLNAGEYEKIASAETTTYTDKNVTAGNTYYYKITAVNVLNGKEYVSPMSPAVAAAVKTKPLNEETVSDKDTGVSVAIAEGEFDNKVELKVEKLEGETPEVPAAHVDDATTYDISLLQNGQKVQPKTTVTVYMPIPPGYNRSALKLYHILDNNTAEDTPFRIEKDDIVFEASAFSKYVLVDTSVNTQPGYMLGDVNNDGMVTAADARLALRRSVNLETYAEGSPEYVACDVDMDGRVTSADARLILRRSVNFIDPEWGVKAN